MTRHLLLTFVVLFAAAAPLRAQEGVIWGWNVDQNGPQPMEAPPSNFVVAGGNSVWATQQVFLDHPYIPAPSMRYGLEITTDFDRDRAAYLSGNFGLPPTNPDLSGRLSTPRPALSPDSPDTFPPLDAFDPFPGSPFLNSSVNVGLDTSGGDLPTFAELHAKAVDELTRLVDGLNVIDLAKLPLKNAIDNLEKDDPQQLLTDLKEIRKTLVGQKLVEEDDLGTLDGIIGDLEKRLNLGASHTTRTLYRAQCDPCAPVGCGDSWTRNLRFQGFGNFMDQKAVGNPFGGTLDGYTAETYGFQLALDQKVGRDGVGGVAFNGAFGKLESNDGATRSDNDMYLVSLYGGLRRDAWTLGGSVGYAYVDYDLRQSEDFLGYKAFRTAYHGNLVTAAGELSRDFRFSKRSTLSPFISLNYIHLWETGFKTSGIAVDAKETESYLQTLGVRWQWSRRCAGGRALQLSATAGWVHDYGDGMLYGGASYDFPGSDRYIIPGASRNKDRALVDVGLNVRMNRRWSAHASYGTEFADHFTMHGFRVGAVRTW